MSKLIFLFILALSFTHCQVISGCLRYFKNQYNEQRCIQCIYGMGLTSSNTCQFCKPGFAVSGGVCKPTANNNLQQSLQTAQVQQVPVQQVVQPQPQPQPQQQPLPQPLPQPQPQPQNIINTNNGALSQQATTSQSYTPLMGNLNSENTAINNKNQNIDSVTNVNAINNNVSWGDNYPSSFQSTPNLNQIPINSQVSSANQSSSSTLLNIPINSFLSSPNQITNNIPNNLPLKNISQITQQPKTITQIPSVISTKPNQTIVPDTPIPSPIPKQSTTIPKSSIQAPPQSVQSTPKQVKPVVHKYPQYPFCFDYADGSCWACVPEYVLNLIINQCIPYVKPPNIAFAQKTQQKPITSAPDQNCDVYSKQKGICEECFRNYYFDIQKKQCLAVNQLCRTYNKQNGKCQSCYNKYKLVDGQCVNS